MHRPSLFLLVALSLAVSCRTAPGPSVPDAESIVEGRAGADLRADTIDSPFSVTIDRSRWRERPSRGAVLDFWTDVSVLDVTAAERSAKSLDERTFVAALRKLMTSDPEAAAVAFGSLHRGATDPMVRSRARVGLTMSLSWFSDWPTIAGLRRDPDSLDAALVEPRSLLAGVERWAHAFSHLPPTTVLIPDVPMTLPLRRSAFGTPVVTVMVNGRPHEFWLDTGASMTLVSADVAIATGVRLAATDTLALGVVGGHIDARAVYIDSLAIGGFVARGVSAAVVDKSMLRLDQSREGGTVRSVAIDGVIGTDLLRHMDLTIDAAAGTITIRRPRKLPRAARNLFWVGYPVVRLVSRDGRPLLFGLDTGAEGTYVTTGLLRKLPRTPVAARRGSIGGLGPVRQETAWVVRELALSDGDYAVILRNTPVAPERRWTFVNFDGVIGSDIALGARLHIDFENGIFDIRPSAAQTDRRGIDVKVTPE